MFINPAELGLLVRERLEEARAQARSRRRIRVLAVKAVTERLSNPLSVLRTLISAGSRRDTAP